jgi:aspartate carbamoyltransferase regulatory subunit
MPAIFSKDGSYTNIYKTITKLDNYEVSKTVDFNNNLFVYVNTDKKFYDIGHQYGDNPVLIIDNDSRKQFKMSSVIKKEVTDYSSWLLNDTIFKDDDLRVKQIQSTFLIDNMNQMQYQPLIYRTMANNTSNVIKLIFKVKPNEVINIKLQKIYELVLAEDELEKLLSTETNKTISQMQDEPVTDLGEVVIVDPSICLNEFNLKALTSNKANNLGFDFKGLLNTVAAVAAPIANTFLPGTGAVINGIAGLVNTYTLNNIDREITRLYNMDNKRLQSLEKDYINRLIDKRRELFRRL